MCTAVNTGEIIILSDYDDDDDEDCEHDVSCSEPSVLIVEVEDVKKNGNNCVSLPHQPVCVCSLCYKCSPAALPLCFRLCFTSRCSGWRPGRHLLPPRWGAASRALRLSHTSLHVRKLSHTLCEILNSAFVCFFAPPSQIITLLLFCPAQGYRLWCRSSCGR